ncbi:MAG: amino acid ABC transporter substrate-binding protein [Alphaproteobacteria bacterium]|nr:amino acid ABC transporter substrate-binding protein [Alphaproteobacteria bacterium]
MKLLRFALAAAVLCALAAPASAQELYGTLKKVKESKTFTIGFREASFPFAYYDDAKKPTGFAVELCTRIGEAVKAQLAIPDLQVKYLPVNPQTRIPLLTNGTIDIECGSTTNNLARQQQVDFSYSFYVTGGRLLASKASGVKEIEDLKGKIVGVAPGTSNEKVLKEWLEKLKIETRVVSVRDHAEGMLALETGRIDAYAHDEVGAYSILSKSTQKEKFHVVGRLLSFDPYGLMIRRDDSAFKFTVNKALAMIFRSGEVYPMYKKHFDPFSIPMTDAVDWNFKLNSMPD